MTVDAAVAITGSAGGIGQALVRAFAGAGYFVIGVDRVRTPGAHHSIEQDLMHLARDDDAVEKLDTALQSSLGGRPLGVLINNAAIQVVAPIEQLSVDDFRATVDVNLVAAFAMVKVALPSLQAAHGSVINIGSIHGRLTKPHFSAYATAKGALETFTRALAVELGGRIRVNAISPAAVDTDMLRAGFENAPEALAALAGCHPAGRIAKPAEVAELALFLCGEHAQFINGAVVDINGGIGGRLHDPT